MNDLVRLAKQIWKRLFLPFRKELHPCFQSENRQDPDKHSGIHILKDVL